MRKTLAHLTLGATPRENISAAIAAGFDGVGIRICGRFIGDDSFQDVLGDAAAIRDLRALAADGGIVISNISAFQFYPNLTPDHLRSVVDTTVGLGSDTLVVNCFIEDRARALELYGLYDELAGAAGLRLALEFLPYSTVRDLPEAQAFIAEAGATSSKLLIDALHLDRSGGTTGQIAALDAQTIAFAQLCDARKGAARTPEALMQEARTARLRLGEGELPLAALMAVLPPGVELEYEVADASLRHLPPEDRARAAKADLDRFLVRMSEHAGAATM